MTKKSAPRKLSPKLQSAQWALDSAVVRGEKPETIDRLRQKRDDVLTEEKA